MYFFISMTKRTLPDELSHPTDWTWMIQVYQVLCQEEKMGMVKLSSALCIRKVPAVVKLYVKA